MQPNANNNVMGNASQATPQAIPTNQSVNMMTQGVKPKKNKGMIIGMAILAVLAAGGIGFGVWAFLSGNQKEAKLNDQISNLQTQLAEQPEIDETIIEVDTDSVTDTAEYIYLGEWGLKIKIPETLTSVSYSFIQDAGFTKVYISGVKIIPEGMQYFPEFANMNKNTVGLSTISRYLKGTEQPNASAPLLIFSDDTYDYYFYPSQVAYSTETSEQEWENATREVLKDMLTNPDNYSAI